MKIGVFTDPHYSSAPLTCGKRFNNQSLRKIREAMQHFVRENCDLVIVLGDVTDTEPTRAQEADNVIQVSGVFREAGLETVCLMGNHDAFVFSEKEFYDLLGDQYRPRLISREGRHLLFLDACYYRTGVHYGPDQSKDWTDTFYPHTKELEEVLEKLEGRVYVFMHQNIDPLIPEDHRLSNDALLRDIFHNSGKVKAVYQGHYHPGHTAEAEGIRYTTFAAMCENEGAYHIIELV